LPNCNLFTQHVLFILWRDTTSELWTLVIFPSYCYHLFTLLALFTLLTYFYCFPLDTLTTFISSKPVRLTTSSQVGSKVLGCVVCRFRVAAIKQSLDEAPYINCPKHHKLVRITFSRLSHLSKNNKPWFLNWGETCYYTHRTFLLGFPTGWLFTTHKDHQLVLCCCWVKTHQQYFWRHCPECHEASKNYLLKFGFLLLVR
jgi:hypothetical protein